MQKVVNTKFRSSRWMLKGAFDTVAAPSLKPRNVIDIVGIGRFSGSYYVTRVVHKFDEGYTQSVEVARFGHNPFSPTLRDVQTGLGSPGAAKEVTGKSRIVGQVSVG